MVYICLDTCIWLRLLEIDFNNEDNCFEEICFWLEGKYLCHIVPTNIIDEWNRNKIKGKENAIRHLKQNEQELFRRFKDDQTLMNLYNSSTISEIIQNRIERIDLILNNSEKANINDEILIEAGKRNLLKLPPNHIKEGYKDTVNILALINHLKLKQYDKCIFSTIDGDFGVAKKQPYNLHSSLDIEFKKVNLEYIFFGNKKSISDDKNSLGASLLSKLRKCNTLPNFQDHLKEKKRKEDERIIEERKNNNTINITIPNTDYLENIKHLDLILAKRKSTVWEQSMVKSLIDKHDSYKQYFFNNIGNNTWFDFLKSEGYFDPDKNPDPIQVKDGFQIPYWESLTYLEKLSIQISKGKETELIDKLLAVIKNVSEAPKDNYRTWYIFIKILSNIPNNKIPNEILHFIPIWLTGKVDTMLQTSELCDKLLPKFLNSEPTKNDIEKAKIILEYLFQVEKTNEEDNPSNEENNSYHSRLYLPFLAEKFEKRDITPKVIKYCSSDFILKLGRTLKFLLLDYPKGINTLLKDGDNVYEIKVQIEKENLLISSKLKDTKVTNTASILSNWEDKNEIELRKELISILKQKNINYIPTNENDDISNRLNFALNSDLTSSLGFKSIKNLDDRYSTSEKVLDVFSLIFRNLLDEKTKQNPKESLRILKTICYHKKYHISFYKRISLYVICKNWASTKSLFFDLIKDKDALHLFSSNKYQKELFHLLNKNQHSLNVDESKIIECIIEQGKQVETKEHIKKQVEYWKLGWYSALNKIEPFKGRYLRLSKTFNTTSEHFQNLGEIKIVKGNVSPISTDDLLEKSNKEIVIFIKTFNPKRSFNQPSIDGLAEAFGNAVETEPKKFVSEIDLYQDIPYIYSYRMLNAFSKAWKEQKTFNWEKVLHYCLVTLKSSKFYSNELQIENDDWYAKSDLVIGSIANLLTGGLQHENYTFDSKLLPLAKEIVQIIVDNLKPIEDLKETNIDYPTYSLNSTAGKSLRALFDYSLHRARALFKREDKQKWEKDIKALFEETLVKGIIDGFILEGMYFEQFCFLDYEWITSQAKKHYKSEDREWCAFMGGLAFSRPPYNKELYTILCPHYERAIYGNIKLNTFNNNGLINHLTAFYFWKYETLSSKGLLFNFINNASPNKINKLINFIGQQEKYPKTLSEFEQKEFQEIIVDLWEFLVDKYENSKLEEEQKNLALISSWIVFVPKLNKVYTNLIIKSCKHISNIYSISELYKTLTILKAKGNPSTTAKFIGEILSSLNFKGYITDESKDFIKELVSFLFTHGQKQIAVEFCNKMAANNQEFFLRKIYECNIR